MVTVIIPTYKRAKYIDRAIQSVLNQTYNDVEIIVVDDNNPDSEYRNMLEKRMEKYIDNKKIKYIQHEKNKNGAAARNTGIKIAKGDYITFLDDDDYFLKQRLEIMVNALDNNVQYDCAYTSNIVTRNKKIIGNNLALKSGQLKKELLLGNFSFGSGSNMFFRAEALKKMDGFDESFQRHQDVEAMLRFFEIGKILAINQFLLVKTQDDRSNEPDIERYIKIKQHYFEAFGKEISSLNEKEKQCFFKNNYMQLAYESVREKDKIHYIELKNKAIEYGKLTIKEKIRINELKINNYLKIENIKYFVKKMQLTITLNNEIKKEIDMYENI